MARFIRKSTEELLEFNVSIIKNKYNEKRTLLRDKYIQNKTDLFESQNIAFNIMCTERNEAIAKDAFCDKLPFIEVEIEQHKERYYLFREYKKSMSQIEKIENWDLNSILRIFHDSDEN